MNRYRPAISAAKLRKLEKVLYGKAIEGDTRLGLYLLKLYYKDLQRYEAEPRENDGVITLPEIYDDET